jgi:putative phage-type endonuclease
MDTDRIIDILLNRMTLEEVRARVDLWADQRCADSRVAASLTNGIAQHTKEWYDVRRGMFTASEFKVACGQNNRGYVMGKVFPKPFMSNDAMLWGCRMEDLARMVYEFENDTSVREYGLLVHPRYEWMGASPDGITPYGVMLEFKAPYSRKACQISQRVRDERWFNTNDRNTLVGRYMPQVQGQMEECDLNACDFVVAHIDEVDDAAVFWQRRLVSDQPYRYAVVVCQVCEADGPETRHTSPIHLSNNDLVNWLTSFAPGASTTLYVHVRKLGCMRVTRDRRAWTTIEEKLIRTKEEIRTITSEACDGGRGHMFSSTE